MPKWVRPLQVKILPFLRKYQKHILAAAVASYFVMSSWFMWAVFMPQTVAYNYGSLQSCSISPRVFPGMLKTKDQSDFAFNREAEVSLGSLAIYSHELCTSAQQAPKEQTTYSSRENLLGIPFLGHNVRASTQEYPQASKSLKDRQTIAPTGTLNLELTQPDKTFTYIAVAANKTASCSTNDKTLACDLDALQLDYAQHYDVSIERTFKNRPVSVMATAPIETLTPVGIKTTSISAGAVAQDKPTQIVIETDKKLTGVGEVILVSKGGDGTETIIPTTATVEGTVVKVIFGQELPRKASFEVRIASIEADDGSGLASKTYALPFSTSGGPKVTSANIGTRNVAQNQQITLSFDQPLLATQNLASAISFTVGGQAQPVTITVQGQKVSIKPTNPLPLCATFSVKVNGSVQNQFGISGDSAWGINSRAICHTTFSIGTSVRGRSITAYKFGSGSNPVVYMGGTHGSEANSKTIMDLWFRELTNNPDKLTARSLVIIPSVNPDGIATGSRLNANQVDINRNFPATDWKTMVTSSQNSTPTPAGGPHPLSEPESRAVASYIQQSQPRFVFSFHSAAAIVEANEAGDSLNVAAAYASRARYRAVPKSQSAAVFKYDTTGAMEDWMRSSLGKPAVVVELQSSRADEFSRNRTALWNTIGL